MPKLPPAKAPQVLKRPKRVPRGAIEGDGLTARERAFVRERRAAPAEPNSVIARRAGFNGNDRELAEYARRLTRKPSVAAQLYAPVTTAELTDISDDELKAEIRRRLRIILTNERTSDGDKIKAADKLLATIPGGYVPVQIDTRGKLTLESLVSAMGGAPETHVLPAASAAQED